jgi:hypothetical protein
LNEHILGRGVKPFGKSIYDIGAQPDLFKKKLFGDLEHYEFVLNVYIILIFFLCMAKKYMARLLTYRPRYRRQQQLLKQGDEKNVTAQTNKELERTGSKRA